MSGTAEVKKDVIKFNVGIALRTVFIILISVMLGMTLMYGYAYGGPRAIICGAALAFALIVIGSSTIVHVITTYKRTLDARDEDMALAEAEIEKWKKANEETSKVCRSYFENLDKANATVRNAVRDLFSVAHKIYSLPAKDATNEKLAELRRQLVEAAFAAMKEAKVEFGMMKYSISPEFVRDVVERHLKAGTLFGENGFAFAAELVDFIHHDPAKKAG